MLSNFFERYERVKWKKYYQTDLKKKNVSAIYVKKSDIFAKSAQLNRSNINRI